MANYYSPYSYQNYLPYQQQTQQVQPQIQPQIHSSSNLIPVQDEKEAQNYPVAPQTTVTFKNEREPYIYTKTVINPMQPPIFEKFKLVKEETATEQTTDIHYAQKSELEALRADFERLEKELKKNDESNAVASNTSAIEK